MWTVVILTKNMSTLIEIIFSFRNLLSPNFFIRHVTDHGQEIINEVSSRKLYDYY